MDIVVSGGTGLIGTELVESLKKDGHHVTLLTRSKSSSPDKIFWNIETGEIDASRLEGVDAIVHLAGENISGDNPIQGRWTDERKAKILNSRVKGTTLLSDTIAKLKNPPKVFVSASAVGYYGSRDTESLNEKSSKGSGFLSDVCQSWENSAKSAKDKGIRVAHTRFGVVLSNEGGALKSMLLPYKMGVGGIIGNGKQYMSWIDITDVAGAIKHVINNNIEGIVNVVSPNPVTNAEYTKALGHVIHRPTIFPIPALGINVLFGEMGNELLLGSQKVLPEVLLNSGYKFQYPDVTSSLEHVLNNKSAKESSVV